MLLLSFIFTTILLAWNDLITIFNMYLKSFILTIFIAWNDLITIYNKIH